MAFPFSALPSDTTVCGEDIRPSVTKRRVAVRGREDRSVLFPKPCIPFRGIPRSSEVSVPDRVSVPGSGG